MEQIQVIFDMVEFQSMMWLLLIPVAMMGLDVLTGLINAFSKNQFESAKMRAGLAKKSRGNGHHRNRHAVYLWDGHTAGIVKGRLSLYRFHGADEHLRESKQIRRAASGIRHKNAAQH